MIVCWQFILLFSLAILGGCSAAVVSQTSAPKKVPPEYESIIRAALQSNAKPDKGSATNSGTSETSDRITRISRNYVPFEISFPRQMDIVGGWMWRICLKGNNKGAVVYLAVFIKGNHIADVRTNVASDRCDEEAYKQFHAIHALPPASTSQKHRPLQRDGGTALIFQ